MTSSNPSTLAALHPIVMCGPPQLAQTRKIVGNCDWPLAPRTPPAAGTSSLYGDRLRCFAGEFECSCVERAGDSLRRCSWSDCLRLGDASARCG